MRDVVIDDLGQSCDLYRRQHRSRRLIEQEWAKSEELRVSCKPRSSEVTAHKELHWDTLNSQPLNASVRCLVPSSNYSQKFLTDDGNDSFLKFTLRLLTIKDCHVVA